MVRAAARLSLALLVAGCGVEPAALDLDGAGSGTPDATTSQDAAPWPDAVAEPEPLAPPPSALVELDLFVDPDTLAELNDQEAEGEALEVEVDAVLGGQPWSGVLLELHGGISRTFPKKSYRLTFPDDAPLETTLFAPAGPPESHRRLVLQASWIDPTWLRNALTMDLIRATGGLAPRSGFARVRFNGEPHGLYAVIERVDRPYLSRHGLHPEGNVYKAVNHHANWADKADPMKGYEQKINEDNPTDDLADLLGALSHTPETAEAFAEHVEPRLHLGDFLRWQMVHTLAMNRDTYTKNYYLHHDLSQPAGAPAARFRVITWDADATWGQSWDATPLVPDDTAWHGTDAFSPRLFSIPTWRDSYVALYEAHLSGPLAPEPLQARVAALSTLIAQAARDDLALWSRPWDYDDEITRLHAVIATRHAIMTTVLAGL